MLGEPLQPVSLTSVEKDAAKIVYTRDVRKSSKDAFRLWNPDGTANVNVREIRRGSTASSTGAVGSRTPAESSYSKSPDESEIKTESGYPCKSPEQPEVKSSEEVESW